MDQPGRASFAPDERRYSPTTSACPAARADVHPGSDAEEVAALCGMSTDYYSRLERGRGPQPSEQMLAAIARGLRLTLDERDHLFVLAGPQRTCPHHRQRPRQRRDDADPRPPRRHPGAGGHRTGETLIQTPLAVALLGDQTHYTGPARSIIYRWFNSPEERNLYVPDDHPTHSRVYVAQLRGVASREGRKSRAAALAQRLCGESTEFAALWAQHEVGVTFAGTKRVIHPHIGTISLHCQVLVDPDQSQSLLVFTAIPGSVDQDNSDCSP